MLPQEGQGDSATPYATYIMSENDGLCHTLSHLNISG